VRPGDERNRSLIYSIAEPVDTDMTGLEIYVAEGIISALGVYHHILKGKTGGNALVVASGGKGLLNPIDATLSRGLVSLRGVTICADSDVPVEYLISMIRKHPLAKLFKFRVLYNRLEEDFGVKGEMVSPVMTRINIGVRDGNHAETTRRA
jgi:hypothetical protein